MNAKTLLPALRFALLFLVLCGLVYPAITTLVGSALFPNQARGSLITRNGQNVGSSLVGQTFSGPQYLIGRPSAAGAGYNPTSLSGSNLATSNPALRTRLEASSKEIAAREGIPVNQIPPELLAASGSGIDPHISPRSAEIQVARIARVRKISLDDMRRIIAQHTEDQTLGLGQARVNVLEVNLALDGLSKQN